MKRDKEPDFCGVCSPSCSNYMYIQQECWSKVVRLLDTKGQPVQLGDPCLYPGTYETSHFYKNIHPKSRDKRHY